MNIVLLVYLASIVDTVKASAGVLFMIILIAFLFYLFVCLMDGERVRHGKKISAVILFMGLVNLFTPSEKTIYLMAGASIAQDIANSPKTAAAMEKVYKIVEKKLDSQLEELMDKAEKKVKEQTK
jgi:hypothetical protein